MLDCNANVMSRLKSFESDNEVVLEVTPVKECFDCGGGKSHLAQDMQTSLLYSKLKDVSAQPDPQETGLLVEAS